MPTMILPPSISERRCATVAGLADVRIELGTARLTLSCGADSRAVAAVRDPGYEVVS